MPLKQKCSLLLFFFQIVGENLEAIKDYEAVLKREPIKPVEVVSLIGLAEALIASARKYYEQFFYSNLKDACLHAITSLIKYVECRSIASWERFSLQCKKILQYFIFLCYVNYLKSAC